MSKANTNAGWRNSSGHYSKKRSPGYIIGIWLASFLSIGLMILTGSFVRSDLAAFKSCDSSNILTDSACGKHSLNIGDLAFIGLFLLTVIFTATLFTGALRTIRRRTT